MTKIIVKLIFFTFLLVSQLFSQSGILNVEVSGYEEMAGKISIGLFNNAESFPKKSENSLGVDIEILDSAVTYTFSDLEFGEYALAIYHDENGDGELDRNFLGMPTEDYVFSNYATGTFGPPSFEDAKFLLDDSLSIFLEINK